MWSQRGSSQKWGSDLIVEAREVERVRKRLIAAELSVEEAGWAVEPTEKVLESFKKNARQLGEL